MIKTILTSMDVLYARSRCLHRWDTIARSKTFFCRVILHGSAVKVLLPTIDSQRAVCLYVTTQDLII
jgi:hypothetical protein